MEKDSFIQHVLPLRPRLVAYAQRFMDNTDDAEDVVQETLLKLWSMKAELPAYNSIAALSMTIVKHLCLNAIKYRDGRRAGLDALNEAAAEASPYSILEQKDSLRHVSQIIGRLPDLQRAVLKMRHLEGMEIDEIARITGSAPEAVRMNLSRARKKVKDLYFKITQ